MRSPAIVLLVGAALVVASCSGGESTSATSPAVTVTTNSLATTVPSTTTSTVTEQADPATEPFPVGEPVDLLVMSDSSAIGLAERFAVLAAEALDREVRVHDWARGGTRITEILDWVQTILADEVTEAEIIIVYGHPLGLEYSLPEPSILSCFEAADVVLDPEGYTGDWTPGTRWEPTPVVPTVEDWQPLWDVFDQIYDEIWKLRDGQPTIIRTYDVPLGFLAPWKELGIESECTANWEVQFQAVREAAEANGADFVSVFDVFNGPNHDEDPNEKGWMYEDGWHVGEVGLDIVAELLAADGFDPSEPPTKETSGAAVAFDYSQDSICDWFTGEDMARIVAYAQYPSGVEMDFGENWECTPNGWYSALAEVELAQYPGSPAIGDFVASEMLDPSITHSGLEKTNVWHLGGIRVVLRIEGHEDISFRFVADPGSATLDTSQKASLGFEIANAMLREMNWVD